MYQIEKVEYSKLTTNAVKSMYKRFPIKSAIKLLQIKKILQIKKKSTEFC